MKTFKDLLENNKDLLKDIEGDLVDLFESYYNTDEIEELDAWNVVETLDHNGDLHTLVDGMIDIYNYDLRKWSVDNYNYIEDAMSEGLCGGEAFHEMIQAGQYVCYREYINEQVKELVELVNEVSLEESNNKPVDFTSDDIPF